MTFAQGPWYIGSAQSKTEGRQCPHQTVRELSSYGYEKESEFEPSTIDSNSDLLIV